VCRQSLNAPAEPIPAPMEPVSRERSWGLDSIGAAGIGVGRNGEASRVVARRIRRRLGHGHSQHRHGRGTAAVAQPVGVHHALQSSGKRPASKSGRRHDRRHRQADAKPPRHHRSRRYSERQKNHNQMINHGYMIRLAQCWSFPLAVCSVFPACSRRLAGRRESRNLWIHENLDWIFHADTKTRVAVGFRVWLSFSHWRDPPCGLQQKVSRMSDLPLLLLGKQENPVATVI